MGRGGERNGGSECVCLRGVVVDVSGGGGNLQILAVHNCSRYERPRHLSLTTTHRTRSGFSITFFRAARAPNGLSRCSPCHLYAAANLAFSLIGCVFIEASSAALLAIFGGE